MHTQGSEKCKSGLDIHTKHSEGWTHSQVQNICTWKIVHADARCLPNVHADIHCHCPNALCCLVAPLSLRFFALSPVRLFVTVSKAKHDKINTWSCILRASSSTRAPPEDPPRAYKGSSNQPCRFRRACTAHVTCNPEEMIANLIQRYKSLLIWVRDKSSADRLIYQCSVCSILR